MEARYHLSGEYYNIPKAVWEPLIEDWAAKIIVSTNYEYRILIIQEAII